MLSFFAQGNANILLGTGNKLVRVRKKNPENYQTTLEIHSFLEKQIYPILGDFLVPVTLVPLTAYLDRIPKLLHPSIELSEPFALEMANCLPPGPGKSFSLCKYASLHLFERAMVLELKPKWLNRGISTLYCRNCVANRLKKRNVPFCCLGLLSDDPDIVDKTVCSILDSARCHEDLQALRRTLVAYLLTPNNILDILEKEQNNNDNMEQIPALSGEDDVSEELLLGMTLRDVTVFFRVEKGGSKSRGNTKNVFEYEGYVLTVSVVDVDSKSRKKWSYWKDTEKGLNDSGLFGTYDPDWPFCLRI